MSGTIAGRARAGPRAARLLEAGELRQVRAVDVDDAQRDRDPGDSPTSAMS